MVTWLVRVVLILTLLVVAAVAAVLLIEPKLDLTPYRDAIARQLSDTTGRDVRLDGDIHLALGRHAQVAIRDLSVANPAWSESDQLVRAAEASVGLDLFALLSGVVHVTHLRLRDADAALEVAESGEQSWNLARHAAPTSAVADGPHDPAGVRLVVEHILIENFTLVYRDVQQELFKLRVAHLKQHSDAGMLVLDAVGQANELDMRLAGRVGTVSSLLAGRDIDVDLLAELDETAITMRGHLGEPARLEDIELESTVRGPSLARLLNRLGMAYEQDGDIDLTLRITDLEQGFAWQSTGRLGSLNLDSHGKLKRPLELDDLELAVDANGDDLSALGRIAGITPLPAQPYRLSGRILRDDSGLELRDIGLETGKTSLRLTGSLPVFPSFDKGNTRLEVEVPQPDDFAGLVGTDLKGAGPLRAKISLTPLDSGNEVLDAEVRLGEITLTLQGPLGSYPDFHATTLAFALTGPSLATLARAAGMNDLPAKPYQIAGTVEVQDDGRVMLQLAEGRAGGLRLVAQGSMGRLPQMEAADLAVLLSGESLQESAGAFVETKLPALPFELESRLHGDLAAPEISDVTARLGDARLTILGRIGRAPGLEGTDARIELDIPQLAQLVPGMVDETWGRQSYRLTGKVRKSGDRLQLGDVKVTGDGLQLQVDAAIPGTFTLAGTQLTLQAFTPDLAAIAPPTGHYHPPTAALRADVALAAGNDRLEINRLTVRLGDVQINGKGRLALDDKTQDAQLQVELQGPTLAGLGTIDGVRLPAQPFEMKARLNRTPNGYGVSDLFAKVGKGEISGKVSIQQRTRPYIDLIATIRHFDFRSFLVSDRDQAVSEALPSFEEAGKKVASTRLIPDEPPPLAFLDQLDGQFRIVGKALVYPDPVFPQNVLVRDVDLEAGLQSGSLSVKAFRLSGDRGELSGRGELLRTAEGLTTDWSLKAHDFRFGILAVGTGLARLPAHELEVRLASRGKTIRQLAAAINGKVRLTGSEGETVNAGLDKALGSFLDELFTAVNPFAKTEPRTRVECTAAAVDIVNGVVKLEPGFVIRTDKIDISASGSIDLGTENIDLKFKNSPRKGIGLSATGLVKPYVKVGGNLAKPGLSLDAPSALLSGTAAVATGGLSILATGLLDRVSTAANPCEAAIRQADSGQTPATLNPLDAISNATRRKSGTSKPRQSEDGGGSVLDLVD